LGLAVALKLQGDHEFRLLEGIRHRLDQSLSDVKGYDPYCSPRDARRRLRGCSEHVRRTQGRKGRVKTRLPVRVRHAASIPEDGGRTRRSVYGGSVRCARHDGARSCRGLTSTPSEPFLTTRLAPLAT
jgi:hypothetical protein